MKGFAAVHECDIFTQTFETKILQWGKILWIKLFHFPWWFFCKKKSENQDIIWGDNLKEDGRIAK